MALRGASKGAALRIANSVHTSTVMALRGASKGAALRIANSVYGPSKCLRFLLEV